MERSCPLGLIKELSGRRDGVRSRKCTLVKEWLLENNYSLNCLVNVVFNGWLSATYTSFNVVLSPSWINNRLTPPRPVSCTHS